MAIVYQHRRLDTNEVFYIGIGKTEKRAYSKLNRNKYWKHIVDKYGYNIEITHQDIIWGEACSIEKYLISFWGRKDLGQGTLVNMTDGGDGANGYKHTKQQIENHSQKIKSNKNMLGKNHSEETKQKISNAKKGKPLSEEHKEKMKGRTPWNKGKSRSEETIKKISNTLKGRTPWNKGYKNILKK